MSALSLAFGLSLSPLGRGLARALSLKGRGTAAQRQGEGT
jgi:hypothetical protein